MTNYHLKVIIPTPLAAQEAREKRRKVLEAVKQRRKMIYQQFQKRMQKSVLEEM